LRINQMPQTAKRVAGKTDSDLNTKIRNNIICMLKTYKEAGNDRISGRIRSLSREWDTERVLETNAASLILLSSLMGLITGKRCWAIVSGSVGAFLLTHALQGWCPPLPVIRRLGVRTTDEINNEKISLKFIRGDFKAVSDDTDVKHLLELVEKD
jgi:hypothetical protein